MARANVPLVSFNRGIISPLALARIDIKRTALSAQVQSNWMPRVLGSMMLRPGLEYLSSTLSDNTAFHVPFVFATDDTAIIEFTDQKMRVLVDDTVISRVAVSTAVADGDFSAATGWTDIDAGTAVSTITGGKLEFVGTGFDAAGQKQEVTVSVADQNKEHGLRIIVERGPVIFRCGSTDGGDEYVGQTTLGTGEHSLAFTPTGNFWVQLTGLPEYKTIVDSILVEASGEMVIDTPYVEDDLSLIRYDESADVVYIACSGYQQRKIERRATRSWSIVTYEPLDGPFKNINTTTTTLAASDISGDITLTASQNIFKLTNVGSLYEVTSVGQQVESILSGEDQFTNYIRVTGVGSSQRSFTIDITETWVGTLTLQRSVGEPGAWVDVNTYTVNTNTNYSDGLDNQIIYYRIGFKSGDYTSGSATCNLTYANGNLTGVVRVTGFTDEKNVSAAVLVPLGGTDASSNWSEGEWSDRRGFPSAVILFQGRLWWSGKTKVIGSVSDAYESFSLDVEGDSGVINRSIGSGPVDNINFLERLKRLIIGTDGAEWTAQASSLDEPLTPSNFSLDDPSTQGSASVGSVKIDDRCIFVQRSGTRLFQLSSTDDVYGEYSSADLTELAPEMGKPSITRLAVQRQPDTRVHCVRSDGTVAVLISQPLEDVLCWVTVETDGLVEDAFVLPGLIEDVVYYLVKRTINGVTKRYLEKWAIEDDCQGGTLNKQADSFITYSGAATNTFTGLDHLEGKGVVVWADGAARNGTHTVSGGSITVSGAAVSNAIIGLFYEAQFKSSKMAYAAQGGTALTQRKKIDHLGLILYNTYYQGLLYGRSLDKVSGEYTGLDELPLVQNGVVTPDGTLWDELEMDMNEFPGGWDTDSRVCLVAQAPNPCTVLAAIVGMNTNG